MRQKSSTAFIFRKLLHATFYFLSGVCVLSTVHGCLKCGLHLCFSAVCNLVGCIICVFVLTIPSLSRIQAKRKPYCEIWMWTSRSTLIIGFVCTLSVGLHTWRMAIYCLSQFQLCKAETAVCRCSNTRFMCKLKKNISVDFFALWDKADVLAQSLLFTVSVRSMYYLTSSWISAQPQLKLESCHTGCGWISLYYVLEKKRKMLSYRCALHCQILGCSVDWSHCSCWINDVLCVASYTQWSFKACSVLGAFRSLADIKCSAKTS